MFLVKFIFKMFFYYFYGIFRLEFLINKIKKVFIDLERMLMLIKFFLFGLISVIYYLLFFWIDVLNYI